MAAGSNDLTTLKAAKAYLELATVEVGDDAEVQRLLTAASNFFLDLINRPTLAAQNFTRKFNGTGGQVLVLPEYPITAVANLSVSGVIIPAVPNDTGSGFAFDDFAVYLRNYWFSRGVKNVAVTWTAGYAANSATLLRVEQAVLELIAYKWRRRSHIDQTSKTTGVGQTLAYTQADIPPEVATLVQQMQRRIPA